MILRQVTIVGLGLIGGSLAGATRRAFPRARIVGVSRNRRALVFAKKKNWIHKGWTDLRKAFPDGHAQLGTHLVILCTPVDTLKDFLERLDRLAPSGTVVTDTGSVKGFLVRWAERKKWRRIEFVGAHPMAGSHEQGIEYADPHLFEEALTFVTPGRRVSAKALRLVTNFWKKISGRIARISPKAHDRITAEVSHLPHFLASAVTASVSSRSLPFAASGFLDTTRVAEAPSTLWVPIFIENQKELFRAIRQFERALEKMKKILKAQDLARLKRMLISIAKRRARLP